jgi:hypothetical protein
MRQWIPLREEREKKKRKKKEKKKIGTRVVLATCYADAAMVQYIIAIYYMPKQAGLLMVIKRGSFVALRYGRE